MIGGDPPEMGATMENNCPDCGAENYDGARYCRKCGRQLTSAEFHEAQTRAFDHNRPVDQQYAPEPPRYVPPPAHPAPFGGTAPPGALGTSPLQHKAKGPNWLLIFGIISLVVILGIGVTAFVVVREISEAVATAPDIDFSEGPVVTSGGVTDPDDLPEDLRPWYYPGAEIEESVTGGIGGIGGSVLIMKSDDTANEIVAHYEELLAKAGGRSVVRDNDSTVLTAGSTSVVIENKADGSGMTQVVVAMGKGIGGPKIVIPSAPDIPKPPDVPGPPELPEPPAPKAP